MNIEPIVNPESYNNTIPNQEVFVRVINENGCFDITSFFISAVFVDLGNITEMYTCDSSDLDSNDGLGVFAIGFKKDDIRSEVSLAPSVSLKYYPTLNDALTELNEIRARFFTSESTTIWVRAQEENLAFIARLLVGCFSGILTRLSLLRPFGHSYWKESRAKRMEEGRKSLR